MGLFDYLVCEHPIKRGALPADAVFQTKSLDCAMSQYTITHSGRILDSNGDCAYSLLSRDYSGSPKEEIRTVIFYTDHGGLWYQYKARFGADKRVIDIKSDLGPEWSTRGGGNAEDAEQNFGD